MSLLARIRTADRSRRLITAAYAPSTIARYSAAVRAFTDWLQSEDADIFDEHLDYEDLDNLLVEFFHDAIANGAGKTLAITTLSGVLHYLPHARGDLPDAHLCVRGWTKLEPVVSHPPITWDLAAAVAVQMFRHSHDWLRDAVGVLLSFDCLLRVGELHGLRKEDVGDAKDGRLGRDFRGMLLRLRTTKTGSNQSVSVDDAAVQTLLRKLVAATAPTQRLFPSSTRVFRHRLQTACAELGLKARYVPHSLRHGGATRLFLRGVRVEDIMLRGRWAASKSARIYIQSGKAALLAVEVPQRLAATAAVLADDVVAAFALVAARPARH